VEEVGVRFDCTEMASYQQAKRMHPGVFDHAGSIGLGLTPWIAHPPLLPVSLAWAMNGETIMACTPGGGRLHPRHAHVPLHAVRPSTPCGGQESTQNPP
jgi:hypothetical protein